MATRALVPRADGEGSIGTDAKKWGVGYFDALRTEQQTLTFDATQDWNLLTAPNAKLTLTGNTTFDAPTNISADGVYVIEILQDATGGRTVSWNTVFKWEGDTAPEVPSGASERCIIVFKSDGTNLYGKVFWTEG